jgi:hypothetical protein
VESTEIYAGYQKRLWRASTQLPRVSKYSTRPGSIDRDRVQLILLPLVTYLGSLIAVLLRAGPAQIAPLLFALKKSLGGVKETNGKGNCRRQATQTIFGPKF